MATDGEGPAPAAVNFRKPTGSPLVPQPYIEALLRGGMAGFEVPALRAYEAELAEGRQHKSMSALTGMEGRKQ